MDLAQIAWRDVVLLVAVVAGIYLAIMLLRLMQVGQRRQRKSVPHAHEIAAANDAAAPAAAADELPFQFPLTPLTVHTPAPGYQEPVRPDEAPSFAETLQHSRVEQEVRELRAELAALREELADMQASRRVSPQYADAMALARRGFDAQGIADHCGIARGEAELVLSLAQGVAGNSGGEDDHVGNGYRSAVAGR